MPRHVYPYLLHQRVLETPDTLTYVLKPADGSAVIEYLPGQFVNLLLQPKDNPPRMARPYSISSSPTVRDRLDLTIKIQGTFPQTLKDIIPGHIFGVSGPFGHFVFKPDTMPRVVMLGAGVGVTPFRGMIRYAADHKLDNELTFINVNKTEEDTVFKHEFDTELPAVTPNLKVVLSYTRLPEGHRWAGETGRIDWDMINRHVKNPLEPVYFICGPNQMNIDLKNMLIEQGVPGEQIKLENMGF